MPHVRKLLAAGVVFWSLAPSDSVAATPLQSCQKVVAGVVSALSGGKPPSRLDGRAQAACRMNLAVPETALLDVMSASFTAPAISRGAASDTTACADRLFQALSQVPYFHDGVLKAGGPTTVDNLASTARELLANMCRQAGGDAAAAALFVSLETIADSAHHRCAHGVAGLMPVLGVKAADQPSRQVTGAKCGEAENAASDALGAVILGELIRAQPVKPRDQTCGVRLRYTFDLLGIEKGREAAAAAALCKAGADNTLAALRIHFGRAAAKANTRARMKSCAETLAKIMKLLKIPAASATPKNLITACIRAKGSPSLATHGFINAMIQAARQKAGKRVPKPAK